MAWGSVRGVFAAARRYVTGTTKQQQYEKKEDGEEGRVIQIQTGNLEEQRVQDIHVRVLRMRSAMTVGTGKMHNLRSAAASDVTGIGNVDVETRAAEEKQRRD
jgi:hypothetical protein